ncbi:MAG: DUF3990 domain-containing protein [Anaeroplasmataceae bacterium]
MDKIITIYHGGFNVVEKPSKLKCNDSNDYGKAFYCTEDEDGARLWASARGSSGVCSAYRLNTDGLRTLDIDKSNVMLWLSILLKHRIPDDPGFKDNMNRIQLIDKYYSIDIEDYDIIRGYRADDSYFSYVVSFIKDDLKYDFLVESMNLGNLGYQVAIKSEKAFNRLEFVGSVNCKPTNKRDYKNKDNVARCSFKDLQERSYYSKSLSIKDYL